MFWQPVDMKLLMSSSTLYLGVHYLGGAVDGNNQSLQVSKIDTLRPG